MKQLRNRADEDARLVHMSLQMDSELPSSLRKDLDHLMVLVSFDVIFSDEKHLIKQTKHLSRNVAVDSHF